MERLINGFEKADVVGICQDIIRMNSINPPGNELQVAKYCSEFLDNLGFEVNLLKHSDNRASILACLKGTGQVPGVMVSAHMDTVPIGKSAWKHDPLGGDISEGRIWGRGASDMKGGLAAALASANALVRSGFSPKGDLWIGLTAGEEVDLLGSNEIAKHREVLPLQALLIPEPSSNEIILAQKGALWLEVTILGKSSHGSMPDMGINAIEMMSQFISKLKSTKFSYKLHPLLDCYSMAVTTIKGGVKVNVVPDECSITIDIRTMPGQNHNDMLNEISSILTKLEQLNPGSSTRINVVNNYPAVETNPDDPRILPFREAVSPVVCKRNAYKGVNFYTDSAVLTPSLNVPMIICGPGNTELAHQTDEYVEIDLLNEAVKIYTLAIANYLG